MLIKTKNFILLELLSGVLTLILSPVILLAAKPLYKYIVRNVEVSSQNQDLLSLVLITFVSPFIISAIVSYRYSTSAKESIKFMFQFTMIGLIAASVVVGLVVYLSISFNFYTLLSL